MRLPGEGRTVEVMEVRLFGELEAVAAGVPVPIRGAKQRALLDAMHARLWESLPYVPLGQFKQPFVWRKNITGVLKTNTLVYWNIEKT